MYKISIQERSLNFAVSIFKLATKIQESKKEFVITKQIIRSSSSIGANSHEALNGFSKKDFIHKLSISLKEGSETIYWLKFLRKIDYISKEDFDKLNQECLEISKILGAIILKTKKNMN